MQRRPRDKGAGILIFMPPAGIFPALCIKRTNNVADFSARVNHPWPMQDKTINNALLALYRTGEGREHVEALMALRGIEAPSRVRDRPLSRGKCKRLALSMLPCTSSKLADVIQRQVPGITRKSAAQRAYMALLRLEKAGVVKRDGRVWRIC